MDKLATKTALSELAQTVKDVIDEELGNINTILESINGD